MQHNCWKVTADIHTVVSGGGGHVRYTLHGLPSVRVPHDKITKPTKRITTDTIYQKSRVSAIICLVTERYTIKMKRTLLILIASLLAVYYLVRLISCLFIIHILYILLNNLTCRPTPVAQTSSLCRS